jgi:hypothetical protein
MTIIVDRPLYHVETLDPNANRERSGTDPILKVVRKGDGAFFHMDSGVPEATHELLWRYAHGDEELPSLADDWIEFFLAHDPEWTHPEGVLIPAGAGA